MQPPQNNLDEHGFPQRPAFEEAPEPSKSTARRIPWKLLIFGTPLLLLVVAAVFYGRDAYAFFLMRRAAQRLDAQDDYVGALADLDRAVSVSDTRDTRTLRAMVRMQRGTDADLESAAEDLDAAIEQPAGIFEMRSRLDVRMLQAGALQRLAFKKPAQADQLHTRALKAYDAAVEEAETKDPMATIGKLLQANLYNGRAYARALAGEQLEAGLEDINAALNLLKLDTSQTASDLDRTQAAFLDTRGYLYVKLNRAEEALVDLEESIKLARSSEAGVLKEAKAIGTPAPMLLELEKNLQQTEAVLLHHRGEAHQLLGNEAEAAADFEAAQKLGYDPAHGVF